MFGGWYTFTPRPPICEFMRPLVKRALSRSCSASKRKRRRRLLRVATEGVRHHDELHELLRIPVRTVLAGKPVEKLRVARQRTLRAEVVARLHQPGAEELLPQPVHRHSCCQWVFGGGDPVGEVQARGSLARLYFQAWEH